jgi:hypothetical protein
LLTQWIAKYGFVLIGMAGLAPEIAREWKRGETIVAKAPVVAEAPVVTEAPVERRSSSRPHYALPAGTGGTAVVLHDNRAGAAALGL